MSTLKCAHPDCDNTRVANAEFCVNHEATVRAELRLALKDAEHVTELAAAFEEWCEEHGKPHPFH